MSDGTIRSERRPCCNAEGSQVPGLVSVWLTLDNPSKMNAYSQEMLQDITLDVNRASADPRVVAVVLTGAGDRAFCTGGDLEEYTREFLLKPQAFRAYLHHFTAALDALLACDKPVINRVNGARVGGGQELGMACDLSIAAEHAVFAQAGVKVGSAPIAGAAQWLPLYVGVERATRACALCEKWTAAEALQYGLISEVVPAPKKDGKADLSALDAAVEKRVTEFMGFFPGSLTATLHALRRAKKKVWEEAREGAVSWIANNAMTEANLGFRAFTQGKTPAEKQIDMVKLRHRLVDGRPWDDSILKDFGLG
ncbi:MAG: enoyl-CoA hydratase-related protein [Planctomycetota bacterium]